MAAFRLKFLMLAERIQREGESLLNGSNGAKWATTERAAMMIITAAAHNTSRATFVGRAWAQPNAEAAETSRNRQAAVRRRVG